MAKINAIGMAAIEDARTKRAEKLNAFIMQTFDPNDAEQVRVLKKYVDDFELSTHQMYLYQALSTGVMSWGASWVVARIIPIPECVNYFLTLFLYAGIAGHFLERFSTTDFYNQLTEMKLLYNWCLKNNNNDYDEDIDNTNNLLNPTIQQMIKLLAPLCSVDFMIVWPKGDNKKINENSYFSNAFSFVDSLFVLFAKNSPNTGQEIRICGLKNGVETRHFDVNVYTGFKRAIEYFMTRIGNMEYKELLLTRWNDLMSNAPIPIINVLSSPKSS